MHLTSQWPLSDLRGQAIAPEVPTRRASRVHFDEGTLRQFVADAADAGPPSPPRSPSPPPARSNSPPVSPETLERRLRRKGRFSSDSLNTNPLEGQLSRLERRRCKRVPAPVYHKDTTREGAALGERGEVREEIDARPSEGLNHAESEGGELTDGNNDEGGETEQHTFTGEWTEDVASPQSDSACSHVNEEMSKLGTGGGAYPFAHGNKDL